MAERREIVFIGIPCYGMVAPEVLEDFMRMMFHLGRRMPQYDFKLGIRTKCEQFRARNSMVEGALQVGADWLMMLDDDMVISTSVTTTPGEEFGFIEQLMRHNKDIVGALYYQRTGSYSPVAMAKSGERGYRFLRDDELTGGLQRVDVAGGGALLVRMKVFDRLPQPFFEPEHEFGTDVQLCRAAAAKGFEVWLDSSFELGHLKTERSIVTSRNKHQFQMQDGVSGEARTQTITADVYNSLVADAVEWTGYKNVEEMAVVGQKFMTKQAREWFKLNESQSDADWYRQYPKERVARQIWYNTANQNKRNMTEFILSAIGDQIKAEILDFGCGIGIPAFEFARRGHRVTALDIDGTGTFEFLKWRAKKHELQLGYYNSQGGVPALGGSTFGAIVVMDCLEHIPEWKVVLRELVDRLKPGGMLFSNNGILDDEVHPEHYSLKPAEFYAEVTRLGLIPNNAIAFYKPDKKAANAA